MFKDISLPNFDFSLLMSSFTEEEREEFVKMGKDASQLLDNLSIKSNRVYVLVLLKLVWFALRGLRNMSHNCSGLTIQEKTQMNDAICYYQYIEVVMELLNEIPSEIAKEVSMFVLEKQKQREEDISSNI